MNLRPSGYVDRLIDPEVEELLEVFGAVSIEGPKWCGKTWTSLAHANSVFYVNDPRGGFANRQRAMLDVDSALVGATPHAIDEWQEVPGIWDAVRFEVDKRQGRGRFLLTGSATPIDGAVRHSGAGRIAHVRMRTMSLSESGDSTGEVSLMSVINGATPRPVGGILTLTRLCELIVRGGWPDAVDLSAAKASRLATGYLDTVARTDMTEIDGVRRDPSKVMSLIRSLARNTATMVRPSVIRRDIAEGSDEDISENTIREYLALMRRLYLLEEVPAWDPALRSPTRLRTTAKLFLTDPSLAAAALVLTPELLMSEFKTLGFLFESLCQRDLLIFAETYRASLHHYHDDAGLEADAILTLPDGRWCGIEIKLGYQQIDKAADSLIRLAAKMVKGGHRPPTCLAVIVGVGAIAQRRSDGVYVLPIECLSA